MALDHEDVLKEEKVIPLDEDDIAILKTYVCVLLMSHSDSGVYLSNFIHN